MITQAEGQKDFPDGYYYDESAGKDIRVYIIDTGLDAENEVEYIQDLHLP